MFECRKDDGVFVFIKSAPVVGEQDVAGPFKNTGCSPHSRKVLAKVAAKNIFLLDVQSVLETRKKLFVPVSRLCFLVFNPRVIERKYFINSKKL